MSKQWARHEAHKNELAMRLEWVIEKARAHPPVAAAAAGLILAAAFVPPYIFYHRSAVREAAWDAFLASQAAAAQGNFDQAVERAKEAADQHPAAEAADFADLFAGDVLYRQAKYKEAAAAYQRAIDRGASKTAGPIALADLVQAREAGGDCAGAIEAAGRFIETLPDHFMSPIVHACVARCQEALGRKEDAKATLEKLSQLYPDTYWAGWAKARLKP